MNAFFTAYRGMDDRVKQKVRIGRELKDGVLQIFHSTCGETELQRGEDLSRPFVELGGIFWTF